ncbi:MAG: hypothetical protein AAF823_05860, partial [Planctomycetota bacterium]
GLTVCAVEAGDAEGWAIPWRVWVLVAVGVAVLWYGARWVYQHPVMSQLDVLVGMGLLIGFVVAATVMSEARARGGGAWAWLAAGALVLAHAQIEMTLFQPAGVAVGWVVLGVASAVGWGEGWGGEREVEARAGGVQSRVVRGAVVGAVGLALAGVLVVRMAVPVAGTQGLLTDAAALWQRGGAGDGRVVAMLEQAATRAPVSGRAWTWSMRLAVADGDAGRIERLLDEGRALHRGTVVARAEAGAARLRGDVEAEIAAWRSALLAGPWQVNSWLELGAALERAGRRDEALAAYAKGLAIDEMLYLDPARQLDDARRAEIEERVRVLSR